MIEFTISRVAMCICGMVILGVGICIMDGISDDREREAMQSLSDEISSILDDFWNSDLDRIVLPESTVPYPGCTLHVSDNLVTLKYGGHKASSVTEYPGSFTLGFGMGLEITHRTSLQS